MSTINNYTEQELAISNKSYTNKDFNTIYPELLDLVKVLTNKWDPASSNESDPGVVLLKLWAILADKNNYNIDKNILEAFPLSVTLRSNAMRLYDMLGYNLRYYRSATTQVDIYYTGSDLATAQTANNPNKVNMITIPKWTMLSNDEGDIVYTLLEDITFGTANVPALGKAILGVIKEYEVNGVTDITLDNLDAENRLFFTESMIAENGIYIENKGLGLNTSANSTWEQVQNLESFDLGQKVFKFGVLANNGSCYIQFPQDIGSLIGNGLNIKYIVTDGAAGNIKANELTSVVGEIIPKEFLALGEDHELSSKTINDSLIIKNPYATTNGADPEDLDSAYKNYKKTVGTFETLVTPRDYANAIYKGVDQDDTLNSPLVSNIVVSDRTCDINTSTQVITLEGETNRAELVVDQIPVSKTFSVPEGYTLRDNVNNNTHTTVTVIENEPAMTAFDIGLYALEPMVDIFDEPYYYNKSFSVNTNYDSIVDSIFEKKSASHDFIKVYLNANGEVKDTVPYIFKNFYTLTGKVATYYKVSDKEADEIEANIRAALYEAFNARNVEFGEAVKFDDILKVVEKADTRIKTVILNEPEYIFKYLKANDFVGTFDSAVSLPTANTNAINGVTRDDTIDLLYLLLAKMIVSGHVQLYNFNRDIEFDFGLTGLEKIDNVKTITTESKIIEEEGDVTLDSTDSLKVTEASFIGSNSDGYKVKPNENIQLYAPNFYTKTAYTAYVNYTWTDAPALTGGEKGYKCNTYYKLINPIQLRYVDENGSVHKPELTAGTFIRFVDDNDPTAEFKIIEKEAVEYSGVKMMALGASLKLEVIDINLTKFADTGEWLKCLWFTNRIDTESSTATTKKYILFKANETEYILQDNEYFLYTSRDLNELVILGSGTMLRRKSSANALTCSCHIDASTIIENGQSALTEIDWNLLSTSETDLTAVELQIITLGEGAGVRFNTLTLNSGETANAGKYVLISNMPRKVTGGEYCEQLSTDGSENNWIKLAVYDMDTAGSDLYKGWSVISRANLLTGPSLSQELNSNTTLTIGGKEIANTGTETKAIMTNAVLAVAGGNSIEVSTSEGEGIKFYSYIKQNLPTYIASDNLPSTFSRNEIGNIEVAWTDFARYIDAGTSEKKYLSLLAVAKDFMFGFAKPPTGVEAPEVTVKIPLTYTGAVEVKIKALLYKDGTPVSLAYELGKTSSGTVVFKDYIDYSGLCGDFDRLKITMLYVGENRSNLEKLAQVIDTLYIGKIKVIDSVGKEIYSDLIIATVENFDKRTTTTIDKINGNLLSIINEKYELFDQTYIVPKKDQIDTSVNGTANKNNLFSGNAIWDKNHICNRFTIPQLNTKLSSITIASSSLKEERK